MRTEPNRNRQVVIIENTYSNKDVNIDIIFEKGYTTKKRKYWSWFMES